jgi:hypothetical protein
VANEQTTFAYEDDPTEGKIEAHARGGKVYITMDNPWAGDSETGFGATTSIGLPIADAVRFARWILEISQ